MENCAQRLTWWRNRGSTGHPLYGVLHIKYLSESRLALLTQHRNAFFLETWNRDGSQAGEPVGLGSWGSPKWWRPFSRDGSRAAYKEDYDTLGLVDVATGERRAWDVEDQMPAYRYISALAISPDGEKVAVGLSDKSFLYTMESYPPLGTMVLQFDAHTGEVLSRHSVPSDMPVGETSFSLAYSPDERFLAAATLDANFLLLYDLSDPKAEPQVLCQGDGCCCRHPVFSPDGQTLATVCGRRVVLWDVEDE